MLLLYWQERRKMILLYFLFLILTIGIASVLREEMTALSYSLMLSIVLFIGMSLVDFWRYRKCMMDLQAILEEEELLSEHIDSLQGKEPKEKLYCELLKRLQIQEHEEREQMIRELTRLKDYYTLWTHEIKTPVSALKLLIGNSEIKDKGLFQGELFKIEEYLDTLLGYVRLNTSGTDYLFAAYSLDELLRKSIRKYAPAFIRKKIDIHFIPSDCEVITDEKWFGFLIDQLLSNALKYTLKGGITIGCTEGRLDILDTGIGIRKEDLPRIWEMGYTGRNGRKEQKSTGMGLAICLRIAKEMSLQLEIVSEVSKGTRVSIFFSEKNLSKM